MPFVVILNFSLLPSKAGAKGMGKARMAAARKLGIRLWIMLRDEIDYMGFCRRGHLRRSVAVRSVRRCLKGAVVLTDRSPDWATCLPLCVREFEEVIVVLADRRHVWWTTPQR